MIGACLLCKHVHTDWKAFSLLVTTGELWIADAALPVSLGVFLPELHDSANAWRRYRPGDGARALVLCHGPL